MAEDKKKKWQPGDLILDRYMPDATNDEREAARENLYALIATLSEIERRRVARYTASDSPHS